MSVEEPGQRLLLQAGALKALTNLLPDAMLSALQLEGEAQAKFLSEARVGCRSGELRRCVQVTGVLRNLAAPKESAKEFAETDSVPALCAILRRFASQAALMLNVCRVLSKLSLHQTCRSMITQHPDTIKALVSLLTLHNTKLVRQLACDEI